MSIKLFLNAWRATGRSEGGYVDNPKDAGGITNHGITQRVARANGFKGDMRDLTKEQASVIAKTQYWDVMRLDEIGAVSPPIANELFDTGFLCGIGNAGKFLQRALNIFNRQQKDYDDIAEDGVIGMSTIYALKQYMAKRGEQGMVVMLRALNAQQGAYFISIGKTRPDNEEFEFGWFLNRVVI
jgi:lysozyme family protein